MFDSSFDPAAEADDRVWSDVCTPDFLESTSDFLRFVDGLLDTDAEELSPDSAVTHAQDWDRVVAFAIAARDVARAKVVTVLVEHEQAVLDASRAANERRNAERVEQGLRPLPDGSQFVTAENAACLELAAALRLAPPAGTDQATSGTRPSCGGSADAPRPPAGLRHPEAAAPPRPSSIAPEPRH